MGDGLEVLLEHLSNGSNANIIIQCEFCGKEVTVRYDYYVQNKKKSVDKRDCCGDCSNTKMRESLMKQYGTNNTMEIPEVAKKVGSKLEHSKEVVKGNVQNAGYKYISDYYKNKRRHVKCECSIHGIFSIAYNKLISGQGCSKCGSEETARKLRLDLDTVRSEFENHGYILPDQEYKDNKQKLLFYCPEHGEQHISYNALQKGGRCLKCSKGSVGESEVKKWLDKNNITYATQYTFDNLVSKKNYKIRFDFAIFDNVNKLKLLIEYDGKQHFEPIEYFGGEETFIERKERDNLKNEYCKTNNIPLLRIKYTEFFNLEKILDKNIKGGFNGRTA